MEKYIGEKKVATVVELKEKTPAKADIVCVYFDDGTVERMSKMRFELVTTTEISNPSAVQKVIQDKVGSYLFGMLHEFSIKMGEVEGILNSVSDYVNGAYIKARNVKWGFEHELLPLLEVNDVLLEEHANKNNSGTPSAGTGLDKQD